MLSRRQQRWDSWEQDKLEANTWRGLDTYSEAPKCVDCCVRAGKPTIFDALSPWFFCRQLTQSMPHSTSMTSYKSCWFALRKDEEQPSQPGDVPTEKHHLRRWKYGWPLKRIRSGQLNRSYPRQKGGAGVKPVWHMGFHNFCRCKIMNLNSILQREYSNILAHLNFRLKRCRLPIEHVAIQLYATPETLCFCWPFKSTVILFTRKFRTVACYLFTILN